MVFFLNKRNKNLLYIKKNRKYMLNSYKDNNKKLKKLLKRESNKWQQEHNKLMHMRKHF